MDSVNWVFKEHPAADLYTVKDVDLHAMFARVSKSNIVFLDAGADFNALSIRFLADVIVTCLSVLDCSTKRLPLGGARISIFFGVRRQLDFPSA